MAKMTTRTVTEYTLTLSEQEKIILERCFNSGFRYCDQEVLIEALTDTGLYSDIIEIETAIDDICGELQDVLRGDS